MARGGYRYLSRVVSSARSARDRGSGSFVTLFSPKPTKNIPALVPVNDRRATRLAHRDALSPAAGGARRGWHVVRRRRARRLVLARGAGLRRGRHDSGGPPRARGEDGTTRHLVSRRLGVGHRARRAVGVPPRAGPRAAGCVRADARRVPRSHVRSALKSCSAASRDASRRRGRRFPRSSTSSTLADDPDPSSASRRARRRSLTVDLPGVEDGRWTQHWDRPLPVDERGRLPVDDGKTSARRRRPRDVSGTSGEKKETEDDGKIRPRLRSRVSKRPTRARRGAAADVQFLCDPVPARTGRRVAPAVAPRATGFPSRRSPQKNAAAVATLSG